MGTIGDYLRTTVARRKAYYDAAATEIRVTNMNAVCGASLFATLLLVVFLLLAPYIVHGWTPTPYHISFVPVLAVFTVIALAYRARSARKRFSTVFCIACMFIIFLFCGLIDIFSGPLAPSSFTSPLIVAMPCLFILPFFGSAIIIAAFTAAYCAGVVAFKAPYIAQYDMFQAIVAFAFSACVVHLVMGYRVQAHETRMRFQELSMRDVLGGFYNKRALTDTAERIISQSDPTASYILAIVDIDDFKRVNDEHGHLAGDAVLRRTGDVLTDHFRSSDLVGRFGGDEFVVFVVGSIPEETLLEKTTSLQQHLASIGREEIGKEVTCSIGAVIAHGGVAPFEALLDQADDALYESKQSGKNCITLRPYREDAIGSAAANAKEPSRGDHHDAALADANDGKGRA